MVRPSDFIVKGIRLTRTAVQFALVRRSTAVRMGAEGVSSEETIALSQVTVKSGDTETVVELRDPWIAAVLAFLIPGAGHLYQGRTTKGLIFMICILGTFFYGLVLGQGRVVYASWDTGNGKPVVSQLLQPFVCQMFVGIPAFPAFIERARFPAEKPLFGGMMVPPKNDDELAEWHRTLNRNFELGTVFTMIAGLLNILVIYDAWGGPMQYADDKKAKDKASPSESSGSDKLPSKVPA